jgi:opacity protein-like surface antigen
VKDHFGTGGNFVAGLTFNLNENAGVQVEYGYNGLTGKTATFDGWTDPGFNNPSSIIIQSHHNMQYIDFNGVFKPSTGGRAGGYLIGGFGAYYRNVNLTTPDTGYVTVCDPWWYVCYPTLVTVDRVIGSRSVWDFGIDIGGGVTFTITDAGAQFYAEVRYHYMWGPSFDLPDGSTKKANGQYLPITFGFRF